MLSSRLARSWSNRIVLWKCITQFFPLKRHSNEKKEEHPSYNYTSQPTWYKIWFVWLYEYLIKMHRIGNGRIRDHKTGFIAPIEEDFKGDFFGKVDYIYIKKKRWRRRRRRKLVQSVTLIDPLLCFKMKNDGGSDLEVNFDVTFNLFRVLLFEERTFN